jgi:PadR family transcriptional regulator, regulatory protein PadR
MNIENTQSQMRKGVLEYCILTLASDGEVYASDIIANLKDAKLIVVEGTLYPLLTRLKNAGLLKYEWKESDQGPPRKYYSLTEEGVLFNNQLAETWSELNQSVNQLTKKI